MKLVSQFQLSAWERRHAYSNEQALERVRRALDERQPIEGLGELRAGLLIDFDSEVLDQVERGEWWLIRAQAEYCDWAVQARALDQPRHLQKVLALMRNPPAQESRSPRLFRLIDSVIGEPLADRGYMATVDGQVVERRTDGAGIAHLFAAPQVRRIAMVVIGA